MPYKVLFDELKTLEQASIEQDASTKYTFNIFSILRKYDDEVGLHSRFLAELLNPQASHGIPIFQQLFIDDVINPAINNQEWQQERLDSKILYHCDTEVNIKGFGRVDIILKSSKNVIVIENKIHASDQKNQLQRYFEACNKLGYALENIYILYLNKDGAQVTNYGKGNLCDSQFGQINYKNDINNWLDSCIQQTKKYPHIEQTLLQYKRLVSSLTGDNRSATMKESHIDLLYQDNNFKLAYDLSESLNSFQIDLQKRVWKELLAALKSKGYYFSFGDKNLQSCDENKIISEYYKDRNSSSLYGIQHKMGLFDGYNIHCFIQLNENIYYGITVAENGKRCQYPDGLIGLANKITDLNYEMRYRDSRSFLGGNILPSSPTNFKETSTIYKLIDQSSREQWVQKTVDEIITFIEDVKALEFIKN